MPRSCYIGLMSGTSMDGIDAAAVSFDNGKPMLVASSHTPYPRELTRSLEAVVTGNGQIALRELLELDHRVADAFANAADIVAGKVPADHRIEAIGSHGQTIFHLPGGKYPNTLQLGDPSLIAERTGITTIADWRRRDMSAGGEGAPLAPAFHYHFLRAKQPVAVLNLGGIANLTYIPGRDSHSPPLGFDTGPANTLLDGWAAMHLGKAFDMNGTWAASGKVNMPLLEKLLSDPYFTASPPKSTGREHFNLRWLEQSLTALHDEIAPQDVAATLVELTVRSVTQALAMLPGNAPIERLLVCGGGVHNDWMMQRLAVASRPTEVVSSSEAGIDPDQMEAMAFAWFASMTLAGHPIDTAPFTGARGPRILGGIYWA